MRPEHFDALFDTFHHTVARLETLPSYAVGGAEGERLEAFHAGRARPLRNVVTDPWLARIARTSADGKTWRRVRVVDEPLTDYQRYQLASYRESQAVGERVSIVRRSALPVPIEGDFWVFDAYTSARRAVLMRYDKQGHWLGADLVDDTATVTDLAAQLDAVATAAVSLNEFLVGSDA